MSSFVWRKIRVKVRTWDGNRVEPRLEALILGLIVAEWEANEAAVGPQQGVLL